MTKTATANKPLQWESEMRPGTGVCQVGRDLGTEGKAARREKATVTGPRGPFWFQGVTALSHPTLALSPELVLSTLPLAMGPEFTCPRPHS